MKDSDDHDLLVWQESDSERFMSELAAEVHKRLTGIKMQAKTITVKLKVCPLTLSLLILYNNLQALHIHISDIMSGLTREDDLILL